MAIWTESQVVVECDFCQESDATSQHTRRDFIQLLRQRGWTIGKDVKCPVCVMAQRKEVGKHE